MEKWREWLTFAELTKSERRFAELGKLLKGKSKWHPKGQASKDQPLEGKTILGKTIKQGTAKDSPTEEELPQKRLIGLRIKTVTLEVSF